MEKKDDELAFNEEQFAKLDVNYVEKLFTVSLVKTNTAEGSCWVRLVGAGGSRSRAREYIKAACNPEACHSLPLPVLFTNVLLQDDIRRRLEFEFRVFIPNIHADAGGEFELRGTEMAVALAASQIEAGLEEWQRSQQQSAEEQVDAQTPEAQAVKRGRLSLDTQLSEEVHRSELDLDLTSLQNTDESVKRTLLKTLHDIDLTETQDVTASATQDDAAQDDDDVIIVDETPSDCVIVVPDTPDAATPPVPLPENTAKRLRMLSKRLTYDEELIEEAIISHTVSSDDKLGAHQFIDRLRHLKSKQEAGEPTRSQPAVQAQSTEDNSAQSSNQQQSAAGPSTAAPPPAESAPDARSELLLPVVQHQAVSKCPYKTVVIDGSNVAVTYGRAMGQGKKFLWQGIFIAYNYFITRGHQSVYVVTPNNTQGYTRNNPQENSAMHQLINRGHLILTPTRNVRGRLIKSYDDIVVLDIANQYDAVVLSNDQYRDFLERDDDKYRFVLENRLLPYNFASNMFLPAQDPLGPHGPNLDEFLKAGNRTPFLNLEWLRSASAPREDGVRGAPARPRPQHRPSRQEPPGPLHGQRQHGQRQLCPPQQHHTKQQRQSYQACNEPTLRPPTQQVRSTRTAAQTEQLYAQLVEVLPHELVRRALKHYPHELDVQTLAQYVTDSM